MTPEKTLENQYRNKLKQRGLAMHKCRSRTWEHPSFGKYHIYDPYRNAIVAGASPWDFSMTLEDVGAWLRDTAKKAAKEMAEKIQKGRPRQR